MNSNTNNMTEKNSSWFITFTLLITITVVLFNFCVRINLGYYKLSDFFIEQSYLLLDSTIQYNKLDFIILHNTRNDLIANNTKGGGPTELILLDYYKNINIITMVDYNEYNSLDVINELFTIKYCNCTTVLLDYLYQMNYDYECSFESNYNILEYSNINEFLLSENNKRANPFILQINTPPDSATLFQFKIDIELLDGRNFELISSPIYIKP